MTSPDPLFDVSGRVAFVTGASSGLGEHFARTLASRGATVVLGARRLDRLEAIASRITADGGRAHAVALDVTRADSVEAAFAEATRVAGVPRIVINNAGIAKTAPSLQLTET